MTTVSKPVRSKRSQSIPERAQAFALKAGARKLFLLSTALSIVIAVLFYYAIASPQETVNEAFRQTLDQKRVDNARARLVQDIKPEFLQEWRRLINDYGTARELLPSEAEISNVLDSVQQMAKANNVKVTMFDASKPGAKSANLAAQPQPTAGDASQPQVTLNERVIPAQIQGNHAGVVRFLNAISRYPRIIYIREFSITSLNREETVNLTLVTYDAPTSGVLPPIPSELRDEFQSQGANTARLSK